LLPCLLRRTLASCTDDRTLALAHADLTTHITQMSTTMRAHAHLATPIRQVHSSYALALAHADLTTHITHMSTTMRAHAHLATPIRQVHSSYALVLAHAHLATLANVTQVRQVPCLHLSASSLQRKRARKTNGQPTTSNARRRVRAAAGTAAARSTRRSTLISLTRAESVRQSNG
jgi:hypothetical protein